MIRFFDPRDPHGVATLQKVLLTLAPALVVIGILRHLANGAPFGAALVLAACAAVAGLLTHPVASLFSRRRSP